MSALADTVFPFPGNEGKGFTPSSGSENCLCVQVHKLQEMKLNIMYRLEMWFCPGTKDAGKRVRALAAAWNIHQVLMLGVGLKPLLTAIAGKSLRLSSSDCWRFPGKWGMGAMGECCSISVNQTSCLLALNLCSPS